MNEAPETMPLDDFMRGAYMHRTGLTDWIRDLPVDVPTRIPDKFGKAMTVIRASNAARGAHVPVTCRTINGAVWICRIEDNKQ